jgi:hypothetical protein
MMTLRARLATISTIVFGLPIAVLSFVSQLLARMLDADVTERLTQLTDGLHGYLRFEGDTASVAFDASDNDQLHSSTRRRGITRSTMSRPRSSRGVEWVCPTRPPIDPR